MKIEPKYNIGDYVAYGCESKPSIEIIAEIRIHVDVSGNYHILYECHGRNLHEKEILYKVKVTKDE